MDAKGGDSRTAALPSWIEDRGGDVVIVLHVQPGARRTAIVGTHGGRLKVAVASPPADGRANAALIELLARRLGQPRSALQLLSGASAREKRISVGSALPASHVATTLDPANGQ